MTRSYASLNFLIFSSDCAVYNFCFFDIGVEVRLRGVPLVFLQQPIHRLIVASLLVGQRPGVRNFDPDGGT